MGFFPEKYQGGEDFAIFTKFMEADFSPQETYSQLHVISWKVAK